MNLARAREQEKLKNIREMLKSLGLILRDLPNSDLKKEYKRFLYLIQSKQGDFKKALDFINDRIYLIGKSSHRIKNVESDFVLKFWKKIKNIVYTTYTLNKAIDEDR